MSCQEHYEELIHRYLDEELEAAERETFESHLAACPECREHLQELGRAIQDVTQLDWHKAPNNFTENLLARLDAEHPPRRNWRKFVMQYSGLAAAVLLVFGFGASLATPDHFALQAENTQGIVVENGKVIVPEGTEVAGDLVIQNGDIEVRGKVNGSITALNGNIYRAAGADISGETVVVDEAMEKVVFHVKRMWNELTSTNN